VLLLVASVLSFVTLFQGQGLTWSLHLAIGGFGTLLADVLGVGMLWSRSTRRRVAAVGCGFVAAALPLVIVVVLLVLLRETGG
jgi:hypothetical protein